MTSIATSTAAEPALQTSALSLLSRAEGSGRGIGRSLGHGLSLITLLTAFVLLVHGYHPWAEDGGLYAAGIKHVLNPTLYPRDTPFVVEHLRFSLFAPLVAALSRATHLSLDWTLFALYCATIWATLYAAWMLASRTLHTFPARIGAVTLLSCWLTLPLAGTSLMLMDPYVTARSISTPLSLLALAWALDFIEERRKFPEVVEKKAYSDNSLFRCIMTLLLAALVHPLMAAYGLGAVTLLVCLGSRSRSIRIWATLSVCCTAFLLACFLQLLAPAESAAHLAAVATRYYWFPSQWRWYERFGLIAPLLILLAMLLRSNRAAIPSPYRLLAKTALALGAISGILAVCFCHPSLSAHLVACLQPLRTFQTVYIVMILFLGATVAEYCLKNRAPRWIAFCLIAGGPMYLAQRSIYPASEHIEAPWRQPQNQFVQAFLWVRANTPADALFAMDPHYITREGEDAQNFRAIAERSTLPDYSKDGGEASITPALSDPWNRAQSAQANIDSETGAERRQTLHPLGVTWLILSASVHTSLPCPYRNATVQVCSLP